MITDKLHNLKETVVNNPSFTLKEQLGYAGGSFGNCMGQDSTQTFSEQFSRDFMGIDTKRMTVMGNILTAVGLLINPITGNFLASGTFLLDTYTGKRRDEIFAELVELRKKREEPAALSDEDTNAES